MKQNTNNTKFKFNFGIYCHLGCEYFNKTNDSHFI